MTADDEWPRFGFVSRHARLLDEGMAQEVAWMQRAARTGRSQAHLWRGVRGLVVPRSYRRAAHWDAACAASAAEGWPVQVRGSGGGLVPQGPGVLNLSLAWPVAAGRAVAIEQVYRFLCGELSAAFARLGLGCATAAVAGSFCDGRYNLAVHGAKLVGTAQCWRRIGGVQIILAHALTLVDADPEALTARCNAFETTLGHERRYRPEAITSVAQAWSAAHGGASAPEDLGERVEQMIAERFAHVVPPVVRPDGQTASKEEIRWS